MKFISRLSPGVGFVVRVAGLGYWGPEFKPLSTVELSPGGVDSACHPSKVGETSVTLLWGNNPSGEPAAGVATRLGLLLPNETASATPCTA